MNIEKKSLTKASLEQLVIQLIEDNKKVFAPVKKDDFINFSSISALSEMANDYIVTTQSAKSIVFPRVETLFEIETTKDTIVLTDKDLEKIPEIILLGTRPCDAAGFNVLTGIFDSDIKDNIFLTRLNKTTIISISCKNHDSKCFCTSVNIDPGGTERSDILLTETNNNDYLAEIITEKGKAILDKYGKLFGNDPKVNKDDLVTDVPVAFNIDTLKGNIYDKFEDDIWIEQSLRCVGCGTCAYVCPTCGCFDIQDVYDGQKGIRKRSWDSCGFDLFTLHASGHNPREVQSQRWRQRIMHKFKYMPAQQGILGCIGCGRCSRACSTDMDLKEHLIKLENILANG